MHVVINLISKRDIINKLQNALYDFDLNWNQLNWYKAK